MRDRHEPRSRAVDPQLELACDACRVRGRPNVPAFLVRRDLGEVEDEPHVDPAAGQLDPRVVVDGEVAERVRVDAARPDERRARDGNEAGREHCEPSHESAPRATGAHRTENAGLWSSAFRYQARISARSPAQPAA